MLLLEDVGGLFGFEVDIFEELSQLEEFGVPFLVDLELRRWAVRGVRN